MSEWITDRKPTKEDADRCAYCMVWTTYNGEVIAWTYDGVAKGPPWMPISKPEPYVSPRSRPKYFVMKDMFYKGLWAVYDGSKYVTDRLPTREAAERIAAIYNEVMP